MIPTGTDLKLVLTLDPEITSRADAVLKELGVGRVKSIKSFSKFIEKGSVLHSRSAFSVILALQAAYSVILVVEFARRAAEKLQSRENNKRVRNFNSVTEKATKRPGLKTHN